MVQPGKERLILPTTHNEELDVGVVESDLVEEDHQTLNNQVNQYFQHIKHYANSREDVDDDDDVEDDDDDENEDVENLNHDDDNHMNNENIEGNDDENQYVNHNEVPDDVDFDLDLNIDRAISESFANYNAAQTQVEHRDISEGDDNRSNQMTSSVVLNHKASQKGIMVNRIDDNLHNRTEINDVNGNVDISSNYGLIDVDANLMKNHAPESKQQQQQQQQNKSLNDSSHSLVSSNSFISLKSDTNRRECKFCGKTFQHAGSLGRHLDNQKGNELHPIEEVEKIRSNVARRGDPVAVKARRSQRSKEYNRREYVKEKNRLRRKFTSKLSRVKESYQMKFYRQINHPTLPTHPSFPRMVLFFLPPNAWPHDPPTTQTFKTLVLWLESNQDVQEKIPHLNQSSTVQNHLEKLSIGFENWQTLSTEEKKDMWIREQRAVFQQLLGDLSIFDFAIRDNWAKHLMEAKKLEISKQKEIYSDVLMSEGNTGTSDHAESEFHGSSYPHSQNESDDSNMSGHHHRHQKDEGVDEETSRGTGQLVELDDAHLDIAELENMEQVKLGEADLAAVAAAAAAAAASL